MGSKAVIRINGLSKKYGHSDQFALQDLTLDVGAGEVYGFLGPNGAGKSTAIRMLMNFISPTTGSASINGLDTVRDSVKIRSSIGYLSGNFAIYPKMTGRQYLDYSYELQGEKIEKNISEYVERLQANLDKKIGELSRGNKQKIGIIQAFMHQPKVLILDEPTSGLDPIMQETFLEMVSEAKKRGACIFMSSHVLSEVQKACDRVGIIREGRLVGEKTMSQLEANAAQTFHIVFSSSKAPIGALKKIKGLKIQSHDQNNVSLHFTGDFSKLFQLLAKHKVKKIDTKALDLEEEFIKFYETDKKHYAANH